MSGASLTLIQMDEIQSAARQGRLYEYILSIPRNLWSQDGFLLITAIRHDDVRTVRMLLRAGVETNMKTGEPPISWAALNASKNIDKRVEIIDSLCAVGTDLQHVRWNDEPFVDSVTQFRIRRALLRNGAPSRRFHSNVPINRRVIITLLGCKRHRRIMPCMDRWMFRMIALEAWAARDEGDQR